MPTPRPRWASAAVAHQHGVVNRPPRGLRDRIPRDEPAAVRAVRATRSAGRAGSSFSRMRDVRPPWATVSRGGRFEALPLLDRPLTPLYFASVD